MSPRKMIDFSRAYERRHGSLPRPLLDMEKDKRMIAEIGLEGLTPGRLLRTAVSAQDVIAIRAGNAVFKVLFLGKDKEGKLSFHSLNNGTYEGEHNLASEERCTLWRGTRMDFSSFKVSMRRLPGKELQVELSAHFEKVIEAG